MKEFKIEIKEVCSKMITIYASNKEEAILNVTKMYKNEEIILGSDDFVATEIKGYSE